MENQLSFLFHPDAQRILNNFTSLFHIRIAFYTPQGEELRVGQDQGLCSYCLKIRSLPGGDEACHEEDRKGRLLAREKHGMVVYTCHGGMTEAVKALMEDGNLIGYIMMGQIRTEEYAPVCWSSKSCGTFQEQPYRRKSEMAGIVELFSDLVDLILSRRLIEKRGSNRLVNLNLWIQNNLDSSLTLAEAAQQVHLSPSRLSHLVKEEYGIPYTVYVRKVRMEQARILLCRHPRKQVKEIAKCTGFSDQRYFSRLFKSETGCSPEEYRKNS
jgi:AraC-like DNA-binding protein